MREDIAGPQGASSRPMWETLEGMVREKAQEFIQQIMEEEVTELLGREKSERRSTVDSAEGYRNGYGKPRRRRGGAPRNGRPRSRSSWSGRWRGRRSGRSTSGDRSEYGTPSLRWRSIPSPGFGRGAPPAVRSAPPPPP